MSQPEKPEQSPKATRNLKAVAGEKSVAPSRSGGKPGAGKDGMDRETIARQVTSTRDPKAGKG